VHRRAGLIAAVAVAVAVTTGGSAERAPPRPAVVYSLNGDLYAVALDRSRTVRLTPAGPEEKGPAVSPDGHRIAFARHGGLWTMNVDGTQLTQLTYGQDEGPAWAPDGRTIYFSRTRIARFGVICGSLFRVDADGRNVHRLTNGYAVGHLHLDVAVSPDGRRIAFSDWDDCDSGISDPHLRVVDTAGRPTHDLALLRHTTEARSGPAWSPDGRRIAFFLSGRRGGRLAIAKRDGSDERVIVRSAVEEIARSVGSPDGKWIAFVGQIHSVKNVAFIVHPDGTGLRRLSPAGGAYMSVAWLPKLRR
jgi:TolB protein